MAPPLVKLLSHRDVAALVLGFLGIRDTWLCRRVSRELRRWAILSLKGAPRPVVVGGAILHNPSQRNSKHREYGDNGKAGELLGCTETLDLSTMRWSPWATQLPVAAVSQPHTPSPHTPLPSSAAPPDLMDCQRATRGSRPSPPLDYLMEACWSSGERNLTRRRLQKAGTRRHCRMNGQPLRTSGTPLLAPGPVQHSRRTPRARVRHRRTVSDGITNLKGMVTTYSRQQSQARSSFDLFFSPRAQ
jgi:hypothetical protein